MYSVGCQKPFGTDGRTVEILAQVCLPSPGVLFFTLAFSRCFLYSLNFVDFVHSLMDLVPLMTEGNCEQQEQRKELEQQHYRLLFLEPVTYQLLIIS